MPGLRDKNLRSGDLQEELGILLLKSVALVAAVPRQEDVGIDAFATLIRPDGNRRLIPDLSFLVQLKSGSTSEVLYTSEDDMAWLRALESPLFIGRVSRKNGRIELFATHRLHQVLLEQNYAGVVFLLDEADETPDRSSIRRVNLGPPVHAWSMADAENPEFLANSYAVLRPHVETLARNRLLRGIQTQINLQWATGSPPVLAGESMHLSADNQIADALREMAPHARRLLLELQYRKRYADFPALLVLFDLMRRWGVDPDPSGIYLQMAGVMADGPELSVEDAIRLRHLAWPIGLDLSRLRITDEELKSIPETVTALALVNASVTDRGLPALLRLTHLKRLNLTGTFVTDEGLIQLASLPALEWLCVHRTQVTEEGVRRFQLLRPTATVLHGSEPGPEAAAHLLAQEVATFQRELPRLLAAGEEGRWALVHGDHVDSVWGALSEAVQAGDGRFGLTPFLVDQVQAAPRSVRVNWPSR